MITQETDSTKTE